MAGPTTMSPLSTPGLIGERERRRQQQIDDIADWYRDQIPHEELKRSGRDVSVLIDQAHRIILVSSCTRDANPFACTVPPEEDMTYDEHVLAAIQSGLAGPDNVVIVDTTDSPGYVPAHGSAEQTLTARVTVLDIASGDISGEPVTIAEPRPQIPTALHNRLLSVPKTPGDEEAREFVARHFFYEFLTSCLAVA